MIGLPRSSLYGWRRIIPYDWFAFFAGLGAVTVSGCLVWLSTLGFYAIDGPKALLIPMALIFTILSGALLLASIVAFLEAWEIEL